MRTELTVAATPQVTLHVPILPPQVLAPLLHEPFTVTAIPRYYPGAPPRGSAPPRRRAPDLLLVCIAIYIATAVGRLHEVFPILALLRPTLLSAMLAIGLFVLDRSPLRAPAQLQSRMTPWLAGFVLWSALSVPGALNQGLAFHAWTDLVRSLLMCFVIAGSLRRLADLERLVFVYFAVTVVYVAVVLGRFQLGAESWRLGRLYFYDANDLATLIVTAMPLGLHCLLRHRRVLERVFAGVGLAVLAVGLIRSGSRGGFLALLAVTAFVLIGVTTIPLRSRMAGLAVILVFLFGAASDRYWSQMQTMISPQDDYNITSEEGRIQVWKRGFEYMGGAPLVGVGLQNFPVAEGTISRQARRAERGRGVRWGAAHNTYIQVAAELGVPGAILFFGMIISTLAALRRAARRAKRLVGAKSPVARLAQTLMAALVGFLVGAFFLSLAYHDMFYVLLAFGLGLIKTARLEFTAS